MDQSPQTVEGNQITDDQIKQSMYTDRVFDNALGKEEDKIEGTMNTVPYYQAHDGKQSTSNHLEMNQINMESSIKSGQTLLTSNQPYDNKVIEL